MRCVPVLLAVILASAGCKSKNKTADLGDEGAAVPPASAPGAPSERAPEPGEPAAVADRTPLETFLPGRLGGLERATLPAGMAIPEGHAIGAYLDMRTGRAINVNLSRVPDLGFARAQIKVLKPGERDAPGDGVSHMGFQVQGFPGAVSFFDETKKSDARMLLGESIALSVSVQPASSHDEAVTLVEELDLRAIEAAAAQN